MEIPHSTNTYIYGTTTALRVHGGKKLLEFPLEMQL